MHFFVLSFCLCKTRHRHIIEHACCDDDKRHAAYKLIESQHSTISTQEKRIATQDERIAALTHQLDWFRRQTVWAKERALRPRSRPGENAPGRSVADPGKLTPD